VKGKKGAGDDGAADNGPVYKEVRPVKLDFSATNFKANVTGWRLSIEKKVDTLFPAVCDRARGIAGIAAASAATADSSEYQDPQILARANLESEEEDTGTDGGIGDTHEDAPGHSGINEDQVDELHDNRLGVDEHHDNRLGIDEHHDNGLGVDEHHDNRVDNDHRRDINEDDDNGIDSEDHDDGDNDTGKLETEEELEEGSALTEISFSSVC
jgi:hypothetical protein